jgi:hypothetical protein
VYQPDVYELAGALARAAAARHIVDIGCGYADKLVRCARACGVKPVGVDYRENIAHCRKAYPDGTWIEADLETVSERIIATDVLRKAVIVCSDVIEHLKDPMNLLRFLQACMRWAPIGVLSTPERDLTYGPGHAGPPPNRAHVREWNAAELTEFLRSSGLTVSFIGLTRSSDASPIMKTLLAVLCSDRPSRRDER